MTSHENLDESVATWAKTVLELESAALRRTRELIGEEFIQVAKSIKECRGKVILSGMGKSGHVARKIAATLASTGTPAFFLHPTEALHGDLGMIDKRDIVILVAFGGETREVAEVGKFAKRSGVVIVAVCGKRSSSLGKLADFFLDASVECEACPLNLAPTASTTVAMALGDALAISVMRLRGFLESDFAELHPDGSLGRRLSLISEHMRLYETVAKLSEEDDFHTVLAKVTQNNFGMAVVIASDSTLLGVITDGDLRRAMIRCEAKVFASSAAELMSTKPKTILSTALAVDAVNIMETHSITALCVLDGKLDSRQLVGIVRMHDLLAAKIV